MAQGPVTVRDSVSPITFPRAKSTLLASSLISYLNLQKEGTAQRILSKLPAWTSHWGGHGYSASALSTQQDGTSLLPSKLNMMRHLLWLMRCEQKPHRSPPGEAGRIHGWFICSLSLPQWKQKLRCCFYQPGPLNEQNTYCITRVVWARDKLVLLSHKDSGALCSCSASYSVLTDTLALVIQPVGNLQFLTQSHFWLLDLCSV